MAHILTRKYSTGATRYAAIVRIRKGTMVIHRESQMFSHRGAAERWARNREVFLEDPMALAREQHGAPTLRDR